MCVCPPPSSEPWVDVNMLKHTHAHYFSLFQNILTLHICLIHLFHFLVYLLFLYLFFILPPDQPENIRQLVRSFYTQIALVWSPRLCRFVSKKKLLTNPIRRENPLSHTSGTLNHQRKQFRDIIEQTRKKNQPSLLLSIFSTFFSRNKKSRSFLFVFQHSIR